MDDFSVAQVDAMMDEADPRADEVPASRRLLRHCEPAVPPVWQGSSNVCCMRVRPPAEVLPEHFRWARSGEYITQVSAIGPLDLCYVDPAHDPRTQAS